MSSQIQLSKNLCINFDGGDSCGVSAVFAELKIPREEFSILWGSTILLSKWLALFRRALKTLGYIKTDI